MTASGSSDGPPRPRAAELIPASVVLALSNILDLTTTWEIVLRGFGFGLLAGFAIKWFMARNAKTP